MDTTESCRSFARRADELSGFADGLVHQLLMGRIQLATNASASSDGDILVFRNLLDAFVVKPVTARHSIVVVLPVATIFSADWAHDFTDIVAIRGAVDSLAVLRHC